MSTKPTAEATGPGGQPPLKRVIGPGLLVLFIVGDILGTGIYSLTGEVANEVGGAVWAPFLCAFGVAFLTAFSYLELVGKYPRAAGAALYTHKAFGVHFLTFIVAFTVMCSGLTSASSASMTVAENFASGLGLDLAAGRGVLMIALVFLTLVALLNLRGVREGVWTNVLLTCIELGGLLIIVGIGVVGLLRGDGDVSTLGQFESPSGESPFTAVTAATSLAFFAMVGFEDSVNMAEETKNPTRIFPRGMLIALGIAGLLYVLVSVSAVSLVPLDQLSEGNQPLLTVVEVAAPGFPLGLFAFITVIAVANTTVINMLMASRLVYGMSRERVLPGIFGRVLPGRRTPWTAVIFTTLLAMVLMSFAPIQLSADQTLIDLLGGTTSLLLLAVFTVVNVAVLVLRKDRVEHRHFRAPTAVPIIGAFCCAFLVTPFSGRATSEYWVALPLLGLGVVLWLVMFVVNKSRGLPPGGYDPEKVDDELG